jgi:hypothetical protein
VYQDLDLVTTIRKSRLKWLGHVLRMNSQRGPKMALEGNAGGSRRKGRPVERWLDADHDDMIKMDVKKWRTKQWIEENGGKYVRLPRFIKNYRATEYEPYLKH